jgi:hypothetical protein
MFSTVEKPRLTVAGSIGYCVLVMRISFFLPLLLTFACANQLRAQIYVEDEEQGFAEYSFTGQLMKANFISLDFPDGFTVSNGSIYVANEPMNSDSEEIDVYDATTGALTKSALIAPLGNNNIVGVSGNYILDGSLYGYGVYSATTGDYVRTVSINYLRSFVVSGSNIFALEETQNLTFQIEELNALTGALVGTGPFLSGVSPETYMAVNGNTLYVSDVGPYANGNYTSGTIKAYNITTGALVSTIASNLDYPNFLTYSNGNLYVATALNGTPYKIEEFSTSGQLVSSNLIPGGVGELIGMEAAPEPSPALLLLVAAVAGAGVMWRRFGGVPARKSRSFSFPTVPVPPAFRR